MSAELDRFLHHTHILARLVEQILERGYLREANGDKITFDQLNLLKFLTRPGPNLIGDVAHFLNASYAAASKAVTRLEKKGFVRSTVSRQDRRAQNVKVTARGRSMIRKYEEVKTRRLTALLRGENVEALSQGLENTISVLIRERDVAGNPCHGCGVYYGTKCIVRQHQRTCPCLR